ncbi:MAG: glutaredoxin family protein [Planctomycetia bacterium]
MHRTSRPQIVLYSRRGCHLCEQAEDVLACLALEATIVDVDAEPCHAAMYGTRVPVVEIDGVVVVEGRFDEPQLLAAIRRGSGRDDPGRR